MRPVYAVSGGVSKFAKARPDKTFQAIVKEAYDYAIKDIGLDFQKVHGNRGWLSRLVLFRPFSTPVDGWHYGARLSRSVPQAQPSR